MCGGDRSVFGATPTGSWREPYGYPAFAAGYAQPAVLGAPPGAVVVQGGNGPRLVTGGNAAPSGGYQWVNQGLTYPPSGYGGYGGYPRTRRSTAR